MNRINDDISISDLSKKLFQLGHENTIDNDILDIEITPNRGDCLSLLGILRELSVFFEVNTNFDTYDNEISKFDFDFDNLAPEICRKITFLKIDVEEEINEFSGDIFNYFKEHEVNRNNFFTDISNFVSYELGQPTHCYDLSKIKGKMIFDEVENENIFKTLTNREIQLTGKNPVFKIDKDIVNLAGVMGGMNTSCSKQTRSVLIECAYFESENIIGQSIKYDIQSDAAYKFERGVDINIHDFAIRRFINIINEFAIIKNIELYTNTYTKNNCITIPIDVNKINKITGLSLSKEKYTNYLKDLGFIFKKDIIEVPSYRNDIENQNDLAEEIARVIGYDAIPREEIILSNKPLNKSIIFERNLKNFLIKNNFYEVINFPFVSNKSKSSIRLDNPLDSNKSFLRESLMSSLIDNLTYNEKRQKDSIKLFEISDVYSFKSEPYSKRKLGLILSGRVSKNYKYFSQKINKDYIRKLFEPIIALEDINIIEISREDLDTKNKDKILYIEMDLNKIEFKESLDNQIEKIAYKEFIDYEPISEFPSSNRDISISVKNLSNYETLQNEIFSFQSDILKDVFVFDFYENIKNNEIKIGFRFIFQSKNKTLTDSEINKDMDRLIKLVLNYDGISIPGYEN
tara:strand:- start:392 stop:2281 length:1890 start_codon:yes stop_codon:yes gene_type:complete